MDNMEGMKSEHLKKMAERLLADEMSAEDFVKHFTVQTAADLGEAVFTEFWRPVEACFL